MKHPFLRNAVLLGVNVMALGLFDYLCMKYVLVLPWYVTLALLLNIGCDEN